MVSDSWLLVRSGMSPRTGVASTLAEVALQDPAAIFLDELEAVRLPGKVRPQSMHELRAANVALTLTAHQGDLHKFVLIDSHGTSAKESAGADVLRRGE